jgi:uncharacterized protein (TIGR03435 family)
LNVAAWNGVDINSMRMMLRSLLKERFRLATHTEQRTASGYALVVSIPKLRRADLGNRPGCKEGMAGDEIGRNWRDPRLSNPLASRLITCRNVTLGQFALELNRRNVGVDGPIVDATRIAGRYDFAVNFSPGAWFHTASSQKVPSDWIGLGSNQLIPISEALRTQLGLELHPQEVSEPVLVIDHVDDKTSG